MAFWATNKNLIVISKPRSFALRYYFRTIIILLNHYFTCWVITCSQVKIRFLIRNTRPSLNHLIDLVTNILKALLLKGKHTHLIFARYASIRPAFYNLTLFHLGARPMKLPQEDAITGFTKISTWLLNLFAINRLLIQIFNLFS